jgi:hypothetical protein
MVVLTTKGQKPPQPQRKGFATTSARGPTFRQLSYVPGLGYLGEEPENYAPFYGVEAAQRKQTYRKYEFSAQSCIQRALEEPQIYLNITNNTGTAPELVVLGDALLKGMTLGRTLFFQSKTFKDPVFNPSGRIFNVDILKAPWSDSWLEPVDGDHFHMATLQEQLHDADRNGELAQYGHVLAISDSVCFSREALQSFLSSRGSP